MRIRTTKSNNLRQILQSRQPLSRIIQLYYPRISILPEVEEFLLLDHIIRGLDKILMVVRDGYSDGNYNLPPEELLQMFGKEELETYYQVHKNAIEILEKEHHKIKDAIHEGMEELGKLIDEFEKIKFPITYGTGKKTH